jgi:chitin disaccharide deacetylase
MSATRCLIVNADDFGLSAGVNAAVIATHARGIVTSASLLVRASSAADAATRSRDFANLSIGLHLDFGEWSYHAGKWRALYEVVPLEDASLIRDEICRQLDTFRRLLGRDPTHIDSHQHVHQREPVRSVVRALAEDLGMPLRHFTRGVRYCGSFYGQTTQGAHIEGAIAVDALIAILRAVQPGVTELACHPGDAGDDLVTMYRHERQMETAALCHPRVRTALTAERIELCTFANAASLSNGEFVAAEL